MLQMTLGVSESKHATRMWPLAGLCVFMADVYMEAPNGSAERPQELHRFLVHGPDGRRLESVAEKRRARPQPPCIMLLALSLISWLMCTPAAPPMQHSVFLLVAE